MSRRLQRIAERCARNPKAAETLANLGVDVHAIAAAEPEPEPEPEPEKRERRRPEPNPNSDGPGDEAPYRRDYENFERDRS